MILKLLFSEKSCFHHQSARYLNERNPWLTAVVLLWTNPLVQTRLSWEKIMKDSVSFLVPKCLQLRGCKTWRVQDRHYHRSLPGPKHCNVRVNILPVFAIQKSSGCCSRIFRCRQELVPPRDYNNVQRRRGTPQTCLQIFSRRRSIKQRQFCNSTAIKKSRLSREFLSSCPSNCKKEEEEQFQRAVYMKNTFRDFLYMPDVANCVSDVVVTNQPICEFLFKVMAIISSQ